MSEVYQAFCRRFGKDFIQYVNSRTGKRYTVEAIKKRKTVADLPEELKDFLINAPSCVIVPGSCAKENLYLRQEIIAACLTDRTPDVPDGAPKLTKYAFRAPEDKAADVRLVMRVLSYLFRSGAIKLNEEFIKKKNYVGGGPPPDLTSDDFKSAEFD